MHTLYEYIHMFSVHIYSDEYIGRVMKKKTMPSSCISEPKQKYSNKEVYKIKVSQVESINMGQYIRNDTTVAMIMA